MVRRGLAVVALVVFAATARGQSGLYVFRIDQDALAGAPDFSALNQPLTAADALVVRDGHFYREIGGDPVRLFGVNLVRSAALPAPSDAGRIARRLRKLGVNLVRLHGYDFTPPAGAEPALSILTDGPYPSLDPESVARMRALMDALSLEGIYVNLAVHSQYIFRPAIDGVPSITPGATFPRFSKPLQIFQPRMIELQAQFAREMLEALQLQDDPVLAMVEIANESSLVTAWKRDTLDDALFPEYEAELTRQWNVWLTQRYGTTEQVAAAWADATTDGPERLTNGGFSTGSAPWTMEIRTPSQATISVVTDAGAPAARVDVTRIGGNILLKQSRFSLERDVHYEGACDVRAELPANRSRLVRFAVGEEDPSYREVVGRPWQVTSQWQRYRVGFEPGVAIRVGRFSLAMQSATGVVLVRNCSLRRAGWRGLAAGETLPSISLLRESDFNVATLARTDDFLSFLADTDGAYLAVIKAAVRAAVPRRAVPITGTQMAFGGLLNLDSHADMDYLDNHFYVDHHNYPNSSVPDSSDWRIRNASGVGSGLPDLRSMAFAREVGRPYTVSEINQPWPNMQAAEFLPVVAAFAAFQDWDAIMHFQYEGHRNFWDSDYARSFSLNVEPHKLSQVGQAAWLFRTGAVQPGRDLAALPLSRGARLQEGRQKQQDDLLTFLQAAGVNTDLAFERRVGVVRSESAAALPSPSPPFVADTNELTYDPAARIYKIHSERAAGLIGYLGTSRQTAGALSVELSSGARGFAAVVLTPLDGNTLAMSRRLLLTAPGYVLRSSNGQPQPLIPYPGTTDWFTLAPAPGSTSPSGHLEIGSGPNWMEPVGATITLDLSGSEFTVFPLDRTGARLASISVQARRFQLQSSPWYEVVVGSASGGFTR